MSAAHKKRVGKGMAEPRVGAIASFPSCIRLERFNDRVTRIEATALAQRFADPNYTLDYERMMACDWTAGKGVNQDDVDTFVLNVRILIQDGDGISLRCLRRDFYAHACTPATLRTAFEQLVSDWKTHLTETSMIGKFRREDGNFTNGELFDVLMYGGLAHVNPDKVPTALMLMRRGAFSTMVFAAFSATLRRLLGVIRDASALNDKLIAHIQTMAKV